MIVLDIETSGLKPHLHSILSIGAIGYTKKKEFYEECRVDFGDLVDPIALEINGFKKEDIMWDTSSKQTVSSLIFNFNNWMNKCGERKIFAGQNPGHFDILFLEWVNDKYFPSKERWKYPFSFKTIDLHTLAYRRFKQSYGLNEICDKLKVPREPNPHNALEGAKAAYRCFKKLLR